MTRKDEVAHRICLKMRGGFRSLAWDDKPFHRVLIFLFETMMQGERKSPQKN